MSLPALPVPVITVGLLMLSNVFMTFAWYGHLKFKAPPLVLMILVSWGIAFFDTARRCRRTGSDTAISRPPS